MDNLTQIVSHIVEEGTRLRDKYLPRAVMRLDYVAVFSRSPTEFDHLNEEAIAFSNRVAQRTTTGDVYLFEQGFPDLPELVKLVKVRVPDQSRPQRGDVDFWISDFDARRDEILQTLPVKDIVREDGELIELADDDFDVLVYFSNPPLSRDLNVTY